MTPGIVWCPHCKEAHKLDERWCPKTGKALKQELHRDPRMQLRGARLIGTVVDGKYKIVGRLGAGALGEIFEAENLLLHRPVAIKVVTAGAADSIARLRREISVIASVHHPNICDVYDHGSMADGSPYLVLERLEGEALDAHLRRHPRLSPAVALALFSQLLSGLHTAHCAGIIHRDLKPANVFLVERVGCAPLVKILDFGLAKRVAGDGAAITEPGKVCGTRQYMAPEQLLGEELDIRADLFSVGIMLFEALTGTHPFAGGSSLEVGANILNARTPRLRTIRRSVPAAFDDVVERALAKDRALRFGSAREMLTALVACLPEEPEPDSSSPDSLANLPRLSPDSGPISGQ